MELLLDRPDGDASCVSDLLDAPILQVVLTNDVRLTRRQRSDRLQQRQSDHDLVVERNAVTQSTETSDGPILGVALTHLAPRDVPCHRAQPRFQRLDATRRLHPCTEQGLLHR